MKTSKYRKMLAPFLLLILLMTGAVAYAAFSTTIRVEGTANITPGDLPVWGIQVKEVASGEIVVPDSSGNIQLQTSFDLTYENLLDIAISAEEFPEEPVILAKETYSVVNSGDFDAILLGIADDIQINFGELNSYLGIRVWLQNPHSQGGPRFIWSPYIDDYPPHRYIPLSGPPVPFDGHDMSQNPVCFLRDMGDLATFDGNQYSGYTLYKPAYEGDVSMEAILSWEIGIAPSQKSQFLSKINSPEFIEKVKNGELGELTATTLLQVKQFDINTYTVIN